jgi:hypothetical protein
MKMITLMLITCFFSLRLTAPPAPELILFIPQGINPYEAIWNAICAIESDFDPNACVMEQNGCVSVGIAQIQKSRVDDFNARYGKHYSLADMYTPELARVVFMAYASEISPYNPERISREWNGGPNGMKIKSTFKYWKLVYEKIKNTRN